MPLTLYEHQKAAIKKLRSGSILYAGVGSGKSRAALAFYYFRICKGKMKVNGVGGYAKMKTPRDLYIITTAKKRDGAEWYEEASNFIFDDSIKITVDSWNNIEKYVHITEAFFIFDEQRAVGYGKWAKSFIKIAKKNKWIMLTATPGDNWQDYIPVFIANGFYKNRTEFAREHIVYSRFTLYPKIEKYINCKKLFKLKHAILVEMQCKKLTIAHNEDVVCDFDRSLYKRLAIDRWNIFKDKPVVDASELCYAMRRLVNSDKDRLAKVGEILDKHPRVIIFYNFNYELDLLREICASRKIIFSEWNGQKHEDIPTSPSWVYLVQYSAGAEGWNCTDTNVVVFYSQSYSYKQTTQAAGRIDRINTSYTDLYYYRLYSKSGIDLAIMKALKSKKNFNEARYMDF